MQTKHDGSLNNSLLLQRFDDVRFNCEWVVLRPKPLDRNPLAIDQEFGEVPLYEACGTPRLCFLQKLPDGRGVDAVHFDFCIQIKRDTVVVRGKFLDRTIVTRLLSSKLIAWKRHHPKTSRRMLSVQSLQLLVVLGCQPSFGSHVDDQNDFILVAFLLSGRPRPHQCPKH